MKPMGVTEFAAKLGVSSRRARKLCKDGRVKGAYQSGGIWIIPTDASLIPSNHGPELRIAKRRSSQR